MGNNKTKVVTCGNRPVYEEELKFLEERKKELLVALKYSLGMSTKESEEIKKDLKYVYDGYIYINNIKIRELKIRN